MEVEDDEGVKEDKRRNRYYTRFYSKYRDRNRVRHGVLRIPSTSYL